MGPKFGAPPPPPSPNKKKGPVSKLETPEPIVPPSPQLQAGTEYLTHIVKLLLSKHAPQKGELDTAAVNLREELDEMGLGTFIEITKENEEKNYSKNEDGEVQFTAPITPWDVRIVSGKHTIETLFDEDGLSQAISEIADANMQKECIEYLVRIKVLFEEEKRAYQEADNARLIDSGPMIAEIETAFAALETKHDITALEAITTQDEAVASKERAAAKTDLLAIWARLETLKNDTNITNERHDILYEQYKKLFRRAVGVISGGKVDHTRS